MRIVNTPQKYEAPILIVKPEKGMDEPVYHTWGLNHFTIAGSSIRHRCLKEQTRGSVPFYLGSVLLKEESR